MTDEVSQQLVVISFRTLKLSFEKMAVALDKSVKALEQKVVGVTSKGTPTGKQTIGDLVSQGQGATSIEIDKSKLPTFNRTLRKYGVDYAIQKDSSQNPPRYLVFFKAKDTDVIAQAFRELVGMEEQKRQRTGRQEISQNKNPNRRQPENRTQSENRMQSEPHTQPEYQTQSANQMTPENQTQPKSQMQPEYLSRPDYQTQSGHSMQTEKQILSKQENIKKNPEVTAAESAFPYLSEDQQLNDPARAVQASVIRKSAQPPQKRRYKSIVAEIKQRRAEREANLEWSSADREVWKRSSVGKEIDLGTPKHTKNRGIDL